jgi:uncharacterized protein (DUF1499 family)
MLAETPKETPMAAAALILSLVACCVTLLGLTGAFFGVVAPFTGFMLFAAGALLGGLLSVLLGLIGVLLSRGGNDPAARTKSLTGLAIGLGLLIAVLGAASTAGNAPGINDITTDLDNPPAFESATVVSDYKGRDMSYPPEFVEIVRASYPDLASLRVASPPDSTFNQAIVAAESLGWKIVSRSPSRHVFDAQHVSRIFRFIDDITIRIVADGEGSLVDMRSKSRDGKSDLGANAARIRVFFDTLR